MEKYIKLFQKYGFKITEVDDKSIMIENVRHIGAFTLKDNGNVVGGIYDLIRKNELLEVYKDDKLNIKDIKIGWSFYFFDIEDTEFQYKWREFDPKELEWGLNCYVMCGDAV